MYEQAQRVLVKDLLIHEQAQRVGEVALPVFGKDLLMDEETLRVLERS